jgi:hypothetical protein
MLSHSTQNMNTCWCFTQLCCACVTPGLGTTTLLLPIVWWRHDDLTVSLLLPLQSGEWDLVHPESFLFSCIWVRLMQGKRARKMPPGRQHWTFLHLIVIDPRGTESTNNFSPRLLPSQALSPAITWHPPPYVLPYATFSCTMCILQALLDSKPPSPLSDEATHYTLKCACQTTSP